MEETTRGMENRSVYRASRKPKLFGNVGTLADLQKVLPYHQGRFDEVMNLAKGKATSPHDLS